MLINVNSPDYTSYRTQQTLDQRNALIDDMKKEIDRQHSQDDVIHKLVCEWYQ